MRALGVVVFAFGCPVSSQCNRLLADIAMQWSRYKSAPVFTQAEVTFTPNSTGSVTYCDGSPGHPPTTLRVAREAVRWAIAQKLDALCVIAAEPHFDRCLRDLKVAIRDEQSRLHIFRAYERNTIDVEMWDKPCSWFHRTRAFREWNIRERCIRLLPIWLYKLVAA